MKVDESVTGALLGAEGRDAGCASTCATTGFEVKRDETKFFEVEGFVADNFDGTAESMRARF